MDRLEGKKEGSTYDALQKECVRQGYKKSSPVHKALERSKTKVPSKYRGNTRSEGGIPFGKNPKS
jgi:hypothetical protein